MVRSARQIRDELKRQMDPAVQRRFAEERRAAIAEYERRYGIRSDEIHQAIGDGRLEETFEVNQWLHLVEVERLGRRGGCVPG
jgi:phage baseplate assembly protein W